MQTEIEIRTLGEGDSIEDLTVFLHRAYAGLAARGLRFIATHQDAGTTRRRIDGGEALLAFSGDALVGTVTWHPPGVKRYGYYGGPGVAAFGQFGVDPERRGSGIGRALLSEVEARARKAGATELACDTAEPATDLIEMYRRWGFRIVGEADYRPATNFSSVVLSKDL